MASSPGAGRTRARTRGQETECAVKLRFSTGAELRDLGRLFEGEENASPVGAGDSENCGSRAPLAFRGNISVGGTSCGRMSLFERRLRKNSNTSLNSLRTPPVNTDDFEDTGEGGSVDKPGDLVDDLGGLGLPPL